MEYLPTTDQLFDNPDLLSKFLEDITIETGIPLGERLTFENVNLEEPEIKDSLLLLGKREEELRLLSEFVNLLISKTEEQLGSQIETIEHKENEIIKLKNELLEAREESTELKNHFQQTQEAYNMLENKFNEMETHYREVVTSLNERNLEVKFLKEKVTKLEEINHEEEMKSMQLMSQNENNENLRERIQTMKSLNEELKDEVNLLKLQSEQLEKTLEENSKIKSQLETLQKDFEKIRDERDWLEQEVEEKSSKLMDSATKYANLEEKYNDLLEKSSSHKEERENTNTMSNGIIPRHAHRKTLLSDLISTKRYFDSHSFEDDVQQTEMDSDLSNLGLGTYENYRTSLNNENAIKDPNHSMESLEIQVPKETKKMTPIVGEGRTGRSDKKETKDIRSQSKEYKEKKSARKQHNEEFYALTFQSILMNSEYFDKIAGNAPSLKREIWVEILDKNIPYHQVQISIFFNSQWYKHIEKRIEEFCQQNYKPKNAPKPATKKFCFGLFG